jgi:hypothetical protein
VFEPPDLSMAAADLAIAEPPDLAEEVDLARPPDLTSVDLAAPRDLMTVPPDLCMPVENCFNDMDDDCNGVINNGCPDTIVVGTAVALTAYGGSGGGAGSAMCATGKVATGVRIIYDDWDEYAAGVAVYCSTPTLVRGAASYTVSLPPPPPEDLPVGFFGSEWDGYVDVICNPSQFQVAWNTRSNTGTFVNGLGADCARGTLTLSSTNQLSVAFTNLNNGLYVNYYGGTEHTQPCPSSSALVGYKGHYGWWMDQIQPVCAPLTFTYK